jgi:hypothetical protein
MKLQVRITLVHIATNLLKNTKSVAWHFALLQTQHARHACQK